jgi:biopolymer transport protein ExbD
MTMAIPKTEDTALNMTPMIDIVFQLVTFFLLTLELAQKEFVQVDLPVAYHGLEDKSEQEGEIPRMIINLVADGRVQFKGNTYNFASGDPKEQDKAIKDLKDFLITLTSNPRWREPDGASKVKVMIHGDRAAKWQYSQWIMQVAANPRIKIYQIQFAAKHPVKEDEKK